MTPSTAKDNKSVPPSVGFVICTQAGSAGQWERGEGRNGQDQQSSEWGEEEEMGRAGHDRAGQGAFHTTNSRLTHGRPNLPHHHTCPAVSKWAP